MTARPGPPALLLQPPPGDLTGPYPALPYLKAYAAQRGYAVQVRDLGIEALHFFMQPDRLAAMHRRARQQCADLEARKTLDHAQQQRYRLLLPAMSAAPEWIAQQMAVFRDPGRFYDHRLYKNACRALDSLFLLLSALHYPTVLTPAAYPAAARLGSLDAILAHRDASLNPFLRYYEEVLFQQLAQAPPALVGISMVFANQSVQALVLGRLIRERFPGVHVTLGGAYLSQWCMSAGDAELSQLLTCADSIVCGEGEEALAALLGRVPAGDPAGLPNLIRRPADGAPVQRPSELVYTDITRQPPPDFSDLDLCAYLTPQTVIPYSISRGCYWGACVFCQNRYGDHRMRRYQTVPVDKALAEMTALSEACGSNHFNFSNDVVDPAYLKRLSRALLDSDRNFFWNTDLRAEPAFDAPACRLMARAGLTSAAIGFESGCQKTLDAMNKGKRVETTARVLADLYQAGVATQAMGIFGMPGESEADGAQTVRFIEENAEHISYYVMGLLMVLPGSRMHADPQAHGVSEISYSRQPLKAPEPVWRSPTRMSADSVNRLYRRLARLEDLYAIADYPYAGGLGTNHGFLYYRLGPDILKRLRRREQELAGRVHALFTAPPPDLGEIEVSPQVPLRLYLSRFALPQLAAVSADLPAGAGRLHLVMPHHAPQPVGPVEAKLLARLDGTHPLGRLLKGTAAQDLPALLALLRFLTLSETIAIMIP